MEEREGCVMLMKMIATDLQARWLHQGPGDWEKTLIWLIISRGKKKKKSKRAQEAKNC